MNGDAPKAWTPGRLMFLSLIWLATNFLWGALLGPMLSQQVQFIVPRASAEALSTLYVVAGVPALLMPLIIGPLSDRSRGWGQFGRRGIYIVIGSALGILGLVGLSIAAKLSSFPAYLAAYVLVQLGVNTAVSAYMAIIPDLVPSDSRGKASGFMTIFSNVGTIAGIALGGLTKGVWYVEIIMAVAFAMMVLPFVLLLKEPPAERPMSKITFADWLKSLWVDPRLHPDFAWVWITRAMMMLGFYLISPYLLFYLRDVIGVKNPGQDVVEVLALIMLAASLCAYAAGQASDRLGRIPVVQISSITVAAAALLFPWLHSLGQALLVGVLFGAGYGAYISADWALGTEVLPDPDAHAKDMGVWHVAMILPQQIGAFIGGALILSRFHGKKIQVDETWISTYQPAGYIWLFVIAALCFALSGVLVRQIRGVR